MGSWHLSRIKDNPLAIVAIVSACLYFLFSSVTLVIDSDGVEAHVYAVEALGALFGDLDGFAEEVPLPLMPAALTLLACPQLLAILIPVLLVAALFSGSPRNQKILLAVSLVLVLISYCIRFLFQDGLSIGALLTFGIQPIIILCCAMVKGDSRAFALIASAAFSVVAIVLFIIAKQPFGYSYSIFEYAWRSVDGLIVYISLWVCATCIVVAMKTPSNGRAFSEKLNGLIAPLISAKPQGDAAPAQPVETPQVEVSDAISELKQYKELLDAGILTKQEFDVKKRQLLGF